MKEQNRETVPWRIKRERCALLVIDMQNDFLKPGGVLYYNDQPMAALPGILRLLAFCRARGIPAVYTKTMLRDDFRLSPLEAACQPVLLERGMREGTWGIEIIDELTPLPEEPVVVKHRYDAFYNTNLELLLRNLRGLGAIDTVIITGTVTNVCCESTARGAFMRDFKVVFVSDANGTFDEAAHEATLSNIGRFFGRVMDTETLIRALEEGEDALTPLVD